MKINGYGNDVVVQLCLSLCYRCLFQKFTKVHAAVHTVTVQYVILPYVSHTLTSLYDENKLCVSCLEQLTHSLLRVTGGGS